MANKMKISGRTSLQTLLTELVSAENKNVKDSLAPRTY